MLKDEILAFRDVLIEHPQVNTLDETMLAKQGPAIISLYLDILEELQNEDDSRLKITSAVTKLRQKLAKLLVKFW